MTCFYTSNKQLLTSEGNGRSGNEHFAAPHMVSGYKGRTAQLRLRSIGTLRELLYNLGNEIVIYSSNRGLTTGFGLSTSHSRRTGLESEIKDKIRELINKYERGESIVDSYNF